MFGTCLYNCKLVGSSKTMGCGRTSTKKSPTQVSAEVLNTVAVVLGDVILKVSREPETEGERVASGGTRCVCMHIAAVHCGCQYITITVGVLYNDM